MRCVDFLRDEYGLPLTVGQAAFVRVAIDGDTFDELTEAEREAALEMFGDIGEVPAVARRTVVAALGRDSGKTEICAGIALFKALTVDISRCGPGDIPRAFVVAPDSDTAAITIERAGARIDASDDLRACLVGEPTKGVITLRRPSDGRLVKLEVRAAARGGKSLRGRSICALICDEAAFFYGEGFVVNDSEIVKAVRPRLLPGGVILLASTPWAEDGLFFDLFAKNHGAPKTAMVAQASTLLMRDHDPVVAANIELERQEDPDNAEREYFARFIAGGSTLFFDAESLALAVDPDRLDIEPTVKGAGVDLALVRDSSALAIVGREGDRFALLELDEKKPTKGAPLKLSAVVAAFAAVLKRHDLDELTADGHVREPAREWADAEDITIEAAPEGREGKWETYIFLRSLLAEGLFGLPNNPRLIAQLRAVRSKPMPGGGFGITSPRRKGSGHGDLASALVLAAHAAENARLGCGWGGDIDGGEPYRDFGGDSVGSRWGSGGGY